MRHLATQKSFKYETGEVSPSRDSESYKEEKLSVTNLAPSSHGCQPATGGSLVTRLWIGRGVLHPQQPHLSTSATILNPLPVMCRQTLISTGVKLAIVLNFHTLSLPQHFF